MRKFKFLLIGLNGSHEYTRECADWDAANAHAEADLLTFNLVSVTVEACA